MDTPFWLQRVLIQLQIHNTPTHLTASLRKGYVCRREDWQSLMAKPIRLSLCAIKMVCPFYLRSSSSLVVCNVCRERGIVQQRAGGSSVRITQTFLFSQLPSFLINIIEIIPPVFLYHYHELFHRFCIDHQLFKWEKKIIKQFSFIN